MYLLKVSRTVNLNSCFGCKGGLTYHLICTYDTNVCVIVHTLTNKAK